MVKIMDRTGKWFRKWWDPRMHKSDVVNTLLDIFNSPESLIKYLREAIESKKILMESSTY